MLENPTRLRIPAALPPLRTRLTFRQELGRLGFCLANLLLNHDAVFSLLGHLNRRFSFIGAYFLTYPVSDEYALSYCYRWLMPRFRWRPWLAGVFVQDGRWVIASVVASNEKDFWHDVKPAQGLRNLAQLVESVERRRQLLGAPQKNFGGILPGLLLKKGLIQETPETDVTVTVVLAAERRLREKLGYPEGTPVIVLGGKGFVGSRVMARLGDREAYCVDLKGGEVDLAAWPGHLSGRPCILLNITTRGALTSYLPHFWPELALLNETYPEPEPEAIEQLKRLGSPAYHLVGVKARAFPSFPRAYAGGIPCCAALDSDAATPILLEL